MKDLTVFNFKKEAVTDSRDVAAVVGRPHKQLMRSIQTMIGHLEQNKNIVMEQSNERIFAPAKYFIPTTYIDEKGEQRPCYLCTRLGCDLIANKMTGEKGTLFSASYVSKFNQMENELKVRQERREALKPASRSLADAINENTPPEHLRSWTFSNYFSLAHKLALGMSTTQLKKQRAIPAGKPVPDYLDSTELEAVRKAEAAIMTLLDVGMDYKQIKQALMQSHQKAA